MSVSPFNYVSVNDWLMFDQPEKPSTQITILFIPITHHHPQGNYFLLLMIHFLHTLHILRYFNWYNISLSLVFSSVWLHMLNLKLLKVLMRFHVLTQCVQHKVLSQLRKLRYWQRPVWLKSIIVIDLIEVSGIGYTRPCSCYNLSCWQWLMQKYTVTVQVATNISFLAFTHAHQVCGRMSNMYVRIILYMRDLHEICGETFN